MSVFAKTLRHFGIKIPLRLVCNCGDFRRDKEDGIFAWSKCECGGWKSHYQQAVEDDFDKED